MNIHRFESLLKKIDPRFRIRQRGYGPIAGIYKGDKNFLLTISKGHVPLNNYRFLIPSGKDVKEKIIKRGRGEILNILKRRKIITLPESIKVKHGIS